MITQRRQGSHAALLWEFPGGKLEYGENPPDCLARELHEELGIVVKDLRLYDVVSHVYAAIASHVVLLVYTGQLAAGLPQPIECESLAWVAVESLGQYEFCAADQPIVQRLMSAHGC